MSLKSFIQLSIILVIIIILGSVYIQYFSNSNKISQEINEQNIETEINTNNSSEKKIEKLPKEIKLNQITNDTGDVKEAKDEKKISKVEEVQEVEEAKNQNKQKQVKTDKPEIENVVKDIEYLTTDKSGNKYKILATSGRTNAEDKNILDLDNVRGVITSKKKSTVYITSDYAEYNSSNLNSNFYQNVIINYEDKEITCDYFYVDMQTNIAIAYNNVVVTDPKSIMKAGKIILNIETKDININPDSKTNKVKIKIN
tara:strand:+ start:240 stop:1007 length:768 start_codon:yes stop_codon:yes gene_type:complete